MTLSKSPPLFENEDRVIHKGNMYAVADGAGGTGLLCGEWAEHLLLALTARPIRSYTKLKEWLIPLAESFVDKYEVQVQQDAFQLRKFYDEGSACTLAAVWVNAKKVYWLTYGDAHVFRITGDTFESHPFRSREELSAGTYLLNWTALPEEKGFRSGSYPAVPGDTYLLATDEISKHIFYLKENSDDFPASLHLLHQAMENEQTFRQYLLAQPDIGEDDYTLIYLQS